MAESDPSIEDSTPELRRALFGVGQVDSEQIAAALARTELLLLGESSSPAPSYDRFVLLRELGVGGCGRVYLAYDPELDRKVALKQLLRRQGSDAETSTGQAQHEAQLLREAQTLAKLRHPHIVSVYDIREVVSAQGRRSLCIIMEFVEGVTLRQWLATQERPLAEILRVFVEAGRGLEAAHGAGIVHRDFKPDNVIIDGDGRARVLDFGLSEGIDQAPTSPQTGTEGSFTGTPAYMAPEQFSGRPSDSRSDVFSYAVTLWEALVGCRPFPGSSISAVQKRICAGEIAEPPAHHRLPRRIDRLLRQALATAPDERIPSMAALLSELERDPWRPLRRAALLVGLLLLIAALSLLAFQLTRPGIIEVDVAGPHGGLRPSAVWVGDETLEVGRQSARGEVSPGVYRLRVEAPGMLPHEEVITVERGGLLRRSVALRATTGELNVELSPVGASAIVDGIEYGSRIHHQALESGNHELRASLIGHYEQRRVLEIGDTPVHEFISLATAEVWSRRHTGLRFTPIWIGDLTGDGLPELSHRTYNLITVSDPWTDRDLWTITLPPIAGQHQLWVDSDGDGLLELVTVESSDGLLTASLWQHPQHGQGEARRRWSRHVATATNSEQRRYSEPLAFASAGSGLIDDTLLLANFPTGNTVALDLSSGALRWQTPGERIGSQAIGARALGGKIIVQSEGQMVRALDGHSGALLWSVQPRGQHRVHDSVELNGDHNEDALIHADETLAAYDGADGHLLWRTAAENWSILESDGEIATIAILRGQARGDPEVSLLRSDGVIVWTKPTPPGSDIAWWPAQGEETAMVEILHASGVDFRRPSDGHLVAQVATTAAPITDPVHVDWDSDGRLDMIVGCADRTLQGLRPEQGWTGAIAFDSVIESLEASGDVDHDGYPELLVRAYGPKVITGRKSLWSRLAADAIRATPRVADVDGDGQLEIVALGAFTDRNSLHIFDAATGVLESNSRADTSQALRGATLVPRKDGGADLLVTSGRTAFRFSGRNAAVLAEAKIPVCYSRPTVADLDGDGELEVIITPWSTDAPIEIRRLEDLTLLRTIDLDGEADGTWNAALVLESPEGPMIVLGLHLGDLVAIDAGDGHELWRRHLGLRQIYSPTVADIDGDGQVELLASAAGKRRGSADLVALATRDGHELRRWPELGSILGGTKLIADSNGGRLLLAATDSQGLVAVDPNAHPKTEPRWRYPKQSAPKQMRASAPLVLARLGADKTLTALATYRDGSLHAIDADTGTLLWRFATGDPNIEATPVAADVDGDGTPEVLIAGHDRRLVVLRTPRARSFAPDSR